MLTYTLATDEQYDAFLQLMLKEATDYLERTMELMQITFEEARYLFRTVGQVYGIYMSILREEWKLQDVTAHL